MNLIESWVTRDRYRVVFTEFGLGVLRYGRRQPHREKDSGMTSEPGSAFDAGITTRRQVMGDEFVDRALARTSGTESEPIQRFVTEHVWDAVWNRPGLSRRDRSLLNLGAGRVHDSGSSHGDSFADFRGHYGAGRGS